MFYLVYCTCMGIIRNIYHVVATMLCVFTQGRRCIVVKFPPHCCLYSVDWGFIMTLTVSQETRARWSNCRSTSTPAGPTSFSQWASSSIIVISVALQSSECVITVIFVIFNPFSKSQWSKCDLKVNLPLAAGQKKTDFHERGVAIIASTALNWAHTANFHIFWHQCVDITIWSAMRNWSNLSFGTGTI